MINISDFGSIDSMWFAHSVDADVRFMASSGGFVKSLLVYLLSYGIADYAIVTRTGEPDKPLVPETIITDRADDILSSRTNSVYAVSHPLSALKDVRDDKRYVFVGLPCQITALRRLQSRGRYGSITILVGLFCNHTPNTGFTEKTLRRLGVNVYELRQIEYRGSGWPGAFTAHLKNGHRRSISLRSYWDNDLRDGPERCRRCHDLAEGADFYVGDPWNLDFEKKDGSGTSLVVCRNRMATVLVKGAERAGWIEGRRCSQQELVKSQGYHIAAKLSRKPREFPKSPASPDPSTLTYKLCNIPIARNILRRVYAKRILARYWRADKKYVNFGDYATEVIVAKMFGYKMVDYAYAKALGILGKYESCLIAIGSELHKAMIDSLEVPEVYVWGQGKGHGEFFDITEEPYKSKVKLFAIRGPHTARQLNLDSRIPMGDPALLLSQFLKVDRDLAKFDVAYVPHWRNRFDWERKKRELGVDRFVDVICTRRKFWSKLREIVSSRFVLTNSLHAAIVCHGFRVPWAFCLANGDEWNFPDKWRDFFEFLGMGEVEVVNSYEEGLRWWQRVGSKANYAQILPLLQSFPFRYIYPLSYKLQGIYDGGLGRQRSSRRMRLAVLCCRPYFKLLRLGGILRQVAMSAVNRSR